MGWTHLCGAAPGHPATDPSRTERPDFTRTHYRDRFHSAVSRVNTRPDGTSWLSTHQLDHLLERLTGARPGAAANIEATRLLREGLNARLLPGWCDGDPEHVRLVDWDSPPEASGNDFLVVSQFRVDGPPGTATPDLVLFVNGLPWVVIECKAPAPGRFRLDEAVEQVIDYAGVASPRAVPDFVRLAQVLIATDGEHAELGTVTSEPRHFAPWRTVEPATETDVRVETGTPGHLPLSPQAVLVAGVLRPAHLLRLVRDFTTDSGTGASAAKMVGRYQQFRAVHRIAGRLQARSRAIASGQDPDHRGGVIWHTQGSGKSLTMAFLVRHLRSSPALSGHKVVVITDRLDLEKQIRTSLAASGEGVHRARSVEEARRYLAVDVADLVLVTVQKSRRDDAADDGSAESLGEAPDEDVHLHNQVANASTGIVVLVDEAHRSHAGWQHARLRATLPGAAFVGFTGTPVLRGARKETREIFGGFTDTYTLRDAEDDRAVVPVRYEAHSVPLEIIARAALDLGFDQEVPDDPERRRHVLRRFARRREVLESPAVIRAKAAHMLLHWARTALPDRFGAQIVTASRRAAVAYREALLAARDHLVAELDALGPEVLHDPLAEDRLPEEQRHLLVLLPYREVLAAIDAAVVISEVQGRRDPEEWRAWTRRARQDAYIDRFKRGIGDFVDGLPTDPSWPAETHGMPPAGPGATATGEGWHGYAQEDEEVATDTGTAAAPGGVATAAEERSGSEPLAFLVVQSMLLTGFDAPVEQVMYLDRVITGVDLLQAIARTNRPYRAKRWGQVVDYVGIGTELATTLADYEEAHLQDVYGYPQTDGDHLHPEYRGEQPDAGRPLLQTDAAAERLLADLYRRVDAFLRDGRVDLGGVAGLSADDAAEELLAVLEDPLLRGEFDELVRDFLSALNAVLPRPQALPFEGLARKLGEVQYLARHRYLDGRDQFSPRRYGAKVRQLIARHLVAGRITERVPPIELSAADFMTRVNDNPSPRARTAYLTGRMRRHITARLGTDLALYERFSARLDEIVERMEQDFETAAAAMELLREDVLTAEEEAGEGGPENSTEAAVLRLLERAVAGSAPTSGSPAIDLHQASRDFCLELSEHVRRPHFQQLPSARDELRRALRTQLERRLDLDWPDTGPLAAELIDLAVARSAELLRYGAQRPQ